MVDEDNQTKIPVQAGSTITLFAGYYADQVASLPAAQQRGAIISKTYKLYLQNDTASALKMVSRFPGGFGLPMPFSGTGATAGSTVVNDPDYNNYRKYDSVPIVNLGIGSNDTNNSNQIATSYFQSGQLLGQFLYSRYTDVGLTNNIYADSNIRAFVPDTGTGTSPAGATSSNVFGATSPYVWNATTVSPGVTASGNGYLTKFCVHVQHPSIAENTTAVTMSSLQLPPVTVDANTGKPQAPEAVSAFRHSMYFNDQAPAKFTLFNPVQLKYRDNSLAITGSAPYPTTYTPVSITELPDKFGFVSNDRYLIGSNTVGSYLYVGPAQFNQLLVQGVDAKAYKQLDPGEENAIIVPIVFQYRMTDYFGPWISSSITSAAAGGLGILGGYDPTRVGTLNNLTYTKKLGIDLYQQDEPVFSFDVQVSATYKKDSLAQLNAVSVPLVAQDVLNVTFTKESVKTLFN